jgi:hypothetical protein
MEIAPHDDSLQAAMGDIWRFHDCVSFDGFCQLFRMNPENGESFPILAAVIENEFILPKIKFIVDILAWQAVVFKVCKSGSLTRDEANCLTNMDIVQRLPEVDRSDAIRVLRAFCFAFNESIVLPGNLLACAENLFKTDEVRPKPDLSGGSSKSPSPWTRTLLFLLPFRAR